MSKPTSHHVSPFEFESVFGFTPCSCHRNIRNAYATYRVEYETESFSSILKRIWVTCEACGASQSRNLEGQNIDGDCLPF